MNNYLKENKIVAKSITLSILVLLSIVFSSLIWGLKNKILEKRQELLFEKHEVLLLDQLVSDKRQEEANIQKALSTLPQSYMEVASLAYKIESVAKSSGLTAKLEFDKASKIENNLASLNIVITTEGGYQNYISFVSFLSNLPYNTEVSNLSLENKNGVTAKTTVKVYVQK